MPGLKKPELLVSNKVVYIFGMDLSKPSAKTFLSCRTVLLMLCSHYLFLFLRYSNASSAIVDKLECTYRRNNECYIYRIGLELGTVEIHQLALQYNIGSQ